ncbi:MAG: hypothetical protein DWH91_13340 [Planctomycetota bacterium]|nr:MAG: hypothetical protein DWH91_13340 [Planctomycetota bacterium]
MSTAPAQSPFQKMLTDFTVEAKAWVKEQAKWWGMAILIHGLALLLIGLLAGTVAIVSNNGEVPLFDAVIDTVIPDSDLTQFDVTNAPIEVSELSAESLMLTEAPAIAQDAQFNDDSATFSEAGGGIASTATNSEFGGLGGFTVSATGPGALVTGGGGIGTGVGTSNKAGSGGSGAGFGGRGTGSRQAMVGSSGGTKASERSVGGGLNWIARHQNPDGSWSFDGYNRHCKDASCSCQGEKKTNAGATAFALLPFLAAGQTHKSRGIYQKTVASGLDYFSKIGKPDGSLHGGQGDPMYVQGVATIVLCEAYGMTNDQRLRIPAQRAVDYICKAQHPQLGGWHYYTPGSTPTAGDLSVVGWQLMALKSAMMSGLEVPPAVLENSKKFLTSVSKGKSGGLGSYMVASAPTPTMTSVGLLSKQFLGVKRSDPAMAEGMAYMMGNLPGKTARNSYYFYYATQVMHNLPGPEWDEWNRATRRHLIETQEKEGCAAGSWNPELPTKDAHADAGGRLFVTSVNTLSLEVYYRFLPLYKLDKTGEAMDSEKPNFGSEMKPDAKK